MVVAGLLNKQVGWELGISEITVKAHRGRVMRKMQATSLTDLVKLAAGARANLQANPSAKGWQTPDGAHYGSGPAPGRLANVKRTPRR